MDLFFIWSVHSLFVLVLARTEHDSCDDLLDIEWKMERWGNIYLDRSVSPWNCDELDIVNQTYGCSLI